MSCIILSIIIAFSLIIQVFSVPVYAGNIDPISDGHKYSYGENVGWFNLAPSQGAGVTVADDKLTGFISSVIRGHNTKLMIN